MTLQAGNQPALLALSINPLKYIENLPEFNGRGEELFTFIELVDNITPEVMKYDISSQTLLLNRIKSKLRGKAREIIEINNHVSVWSEIKSILINNFGDKKSALQIFDELRGVTFTSNSVNLYNEIKIILRRLNNKVKDEPNAELTIKANIASGLTVFKEKLPEPMRSIIFSRNPSTLEGALDILYESNYANYTPFQNNFFKNKNPQRNNQQFSISRPSNNSNNNSKYTNVRQNNQQNYNSGFRQNGHSQRNYNTGNRPNNYNQNNFTDRSLLFNRSQNTRQNYNSRPNTIYSRIEPMDVDVSRNSRVNTVEIQNEVENFHLEASENHNRSHI